MEDLLSVFEMLAIFDDDLAAITKGQSRP